MIGLVVVGNDMSNIDDVKRCQFISKSPIKVSAQHCQFEKPSEMTFSDAPDKTIFFEQNSENGTSDSFKTNRIKRPSKAIIANGQNLSYRYQNLQPFEKTKKKIAAQTRSDHVFPLPQGQMMINFETNDTIF